ncbi:MAG: hypothetical protein U0003_02695 [Vampirovibrionales bacterium]
MSPNANSATASINAGAYAEAVNARRIINGKDDVVQLYPIIHTFAWKPTKPATPTTGCPPKFPCKKTLSSGAPPAC